MSTRNQILNLLDESRKRSVRLILSQQRDGINPVAQRLLRKEERLRNALYAKLPGCKL